jgi:hypothetical protein
MAQRLDAAQKKVGDTSTTTSLLAPGAYAAKFGHRAVRISSHGSSCPWCAVGGGASWMGFGQAKSPKKAPDFEKMHQKMFDVRNSAVGRLQPPQDLWSCVMHAGTAVDCRQGQGDRVGWVEET